MGYSAVENRKVTKNAINRTPDPFLLSEPAIKIILAQTNKNQRPIHLSTGLLISRDDPVLTGAIDELGALANGAGAELQIVAIPCASDWSIGDVYGIEFISAGGKIWPPIQN